jgi:arylsulfatase A-like enzyme
MDALTRRQFLKGSAAAAALGFAAPGCLLESDSPAARNKKPNIVLLLSDELAPHYLGSYGGEIPTPNLDRLAAEGMRITNAYCPSSVCAPSRFTVMTGKYALRAHNFDDKSEPVNLTWGPSLEGTDTVFQHLNRSGYYTGFVGKWGVSLGYRLDLPVVTIEDDLDSPDADAKLKKRQEIWSETLKKEIGMDYVGGVGGNFGRKDGFGHHHMEWMTEHALEFLDEAAEQDKPFFLYAATTAVHGPDHVKDLDFDPRYTPGGKRDKPLTSHPPRETIRTRLEQAGLELTAETVGVTFLDDHVGAILDKLDQLDATRDTLVLFTADHNVEPGKATPYEKGCHVPMLVRWPGRIQADSTGDRMISFVDILPSLLEAGRSPRQAQGIDGVSFLPSVTGQGQEPRDPLHFEIGMTRAIRVGDYKYIAFRPSAESINKMQSGEYDVAVDMMDSTRQMHSQIALHYFPDYFDQDQLYDLSADPYEQNNLMDAKLDREQFQALVEARIKLAEHLATFEHPFPLDRIEFMETDAYRELARKRKQGGFPTWWDPDRKYPPEG